MTKTPKKGGQRRLSPEEERLWQEVTGDVGRLGETNTQDVVVTDGAAPEESAGPPDKPRPGGTARRPPAPSSPAALPELSHDAQPGLDKRTQARLRRGQLPIEARIDLHGLTQDEAHRALTAFLAASRDAGRRCVLVITGKGFGPDGSVGVLRAAVPRWLNEAGQRRHVLAFRHAQPRDGGSGALYVLLKRNKTAGRGP
ncbi:MAG: Smr/MutS family protein [Rhodospirillales bacterium]|jgi:DNA-nicking Smr family endonuclease|nr:Smr/MutS family protein [Rhodospirillales bacterium]